MTVRTVSLIAAYALRESIRRRVFLVVLLLTLGFLGLFTFASAEVFDSVAGIGGGDTDSLATATMSGLGMFGTLFLGAVLAVFLTHAAVRGDAESGLLQPLLVRPVSRCALLAGRFAAAAAICTLYVLVVYGTVLVIVHGFGDRWPDRIVEPTLVLAGAVAVIVALSLTGSVFLSSTANGIATFMAVGAGVVAGLMNAIAVGLDSDSLGDIAHAVAVSLPFEALYQAGLHGLAADQSGINEAIIQLGPFGASREGGPGLYLFTAAYVAVVLAVGAWGIRRRDL